MPIYESEFQGATIDARLAAVATMQTAIRNLESAVAAKYSKPASGIPETDLDAAVQSALAKARSAVQNLSDYYTKTEIDALLAAVNSEMYVEVTTLPTASASTLGKIYLVGPDAGDQYARYYTSYDGSTYSWVAAGTTEINLANYVTKAEFNRLDMEVNGGTNPDEDITPAATHTGYWYQVSQTSISIQTATSSIYTGTITPGTPPTGPTDGLDISGYIGRTIKCTVDGAGNASNRATIIADANNTVLAYKRERDYVADGTKYSTTMVVPANAKYLYFSGSSVTTGLSIKVLGEEVDGLVDRIEALETQAVGKDLKVLLIGSSYGVNTIVQFPALAIAGGVNVTVGNLYTGSATLANIVSIINGDGNFQYGRIYTKETNQWATASKNIATMLGLHDWDIIILQRSAPGNTGGSDTWTQSMASDLETIIQYIAANTDNAPKIMFNSAFSRSVGYFNGSRENQLANVNLIMSTAKEMQDQFGLEIIPAAIAIQNARNTSLAYVETANTSAYDVPDLTGEGDHLDTGVGSYILGCLLYEMILGKRFDMSILEQTTLPTLANVTGNAAFGDADFTQITAQQARIARYAAMLAVREPWTVNTALGELYPYPD